MNAWFATFAVKRSPVIAGPFRHNRNFMEESDKLKRIVEARMKLKARFEEKIKQTPSVSDTKPLGKGKPNRHGMPEVPVGQTITNKWPVLDLGMQPDISKEDWLLTLNGAVEHPVILTWDDFNALPQTEDVSDFHCVTTWSKLNMSWKGVRLLDLAALVQPKEDAAFILCHGYDDYTTNISLTEALKPDVLLVHTVDGMPLPKEHGGPVRMITPQLYAWKGSKWINRIEFLTHNRLGFWERNGYSNTAYPWRNDRYS
jgi:DMSO/TMAO reductase YedYZ molybdopterin-dependent catalytic subunit